MPVEISRRQFLRDALIGATALLLRGSEKENPPSYDEIIAEWNLAEKGPDVFLDELRQRPAPVRYGCSFSPEHWDWAGYPPDKHAEAIKTLGKYGINEVRYGVRWSNTETQPGQFNLDYNRSSFEALLESGGNICLNKGPVKTLRWPEAHIPWFYQNLIPADRKVTPDSELGKRANDHLHRMLSYLTQHYSASELSRITCINPENEAISPIAGDPGLIITPAYLTEVCRTIREYFPTTPFLFNTSGNQVAEYGGVTLEKLLEFIQQSGEKSARLGLDFYYKHPLSPVVAKLPQRLDLVAEFGSTYFHDYVSRLQQNGITPEITELQTEPWGELTSPGNSTKELIYASRRALKYFFLPNIPALMRIWGIEYLIGNLLSGKLTPEQSNILRLIGAVNEI